MVKSDKEKGDDEYKAGYDTGRDGDPATRAFDSFFGYTNSDSTYGKGYQEGLSDRHEYGSRSDNPSDENSPNSHNSSPTDGVLDTSSVDSNTYSHENSGSSTPSVRGLPFSLGFVVFAFFGYLLVSAISWIFIIPFIVNTKVTGIGIWVLKLLAVPLVLVLFIVTIPGIGLLVWAIPGFSDLLPSLHP